MEQLVVQAYRVSSTAASGYRPPAETSGEAPEGSTAARSCTVEQISAMVKAGFSDEQIKAACPD